nr:MAG TPA: hypothetical protein [Caudoviricetes sp.]
MKNENPISIFGKIPFWRLFLTQIFWQIWKFWNFALQKS